MNFCVYIGRFGNWTYSVRWFSCWELRCYLYSFISLVSFRLDLHVRLALLQLQQTDITAFTSFDLHLSWLVYDMQNGTNLFVILSRPKSTDRISNRGLFLFWMFFSFNHIFLFYLENKQSNQERTEIINTQIANQLVETKTTKSFSIISTFYLCLVGTF